ncbi:MAG: aminodeoxychorismate/anthranilate synthase component II [Actinomycetota bacterium]|nr:aminodeoxychorismate/anthranilate synthase component II [Actinomycetota bacterium]
MILVIDNYDSFTYNLVQYLGELGATIEVARNDKIALSEIKKMAPGHIVISPGPCTPSEAGISMDLIKEFMGRIPILGVCLGHQAIVQALGGKIIRGEVPVHGKTSEIYHDGKGVFVDIPNPFTATRYHSLIAERKSLPEVFEISARTADGVIMGVRHKEHILEGIQFHPESILTTEGKRILKNFLDMDYGKFDQKEER